MSHAIHHFFAMGSDCEVCLAGEFANMDRIALSAEVEVRRIEFRYSRYREDSELTRINAAATAGGDVEVDEETAGLFVYARACHAKSDGAFDITSGLLRAVWNFSRPHLPEQSDIEALLPRIGLDKVRLEGNRLRFTRPGMELDLGGLGKEYAADRAAEACLSLGARHGFINLGGDIRVIGPQPDGQPWRIGIRHPRNPDGRVAEIALATGGLATSGDYQRFIEVDGRRYCHILDPRSGWPTRGLSSVTVIADRCLVAGSLATIAMLKGIDAQVWLHGLGVRYLVVDEKGQSSGTDVTNIMR